MKEKKFVYQIQAEGKDYFIVANSFSDAIEKWLKVMRVNRQVDEGFIYGIFRKGEVMQ